MSDGNQRATRPPDALNTCETGFIIDQRPGKPRGVAEVCRGEIAGSFPELLQVEAFRAFLGLQNVIKNKTYAGLVNRSISAQVN